MEVDGVYGRNNMRVWNEEIGGLFTDAAWTTDFPFDGRTLVGFQF